MLDKIKNSTLNSLPLAQRAPIVVGFSGGPDSLSLLHVLYRTGFQIIAAHLDHQLRPDSGADAAWVEAWCQKHQIEFEAGDVDVAAYAQEQELSIEEAARIRRYQFLFEIANKREAQAVLVGHTADDQVETVLMHFLRGSGMSGLQGMKMSSINSEWDSTIPLIRPMLEVWREEIDNYCRENELDPLEDVSNNDQTFFRNRLRQELIPILEEYNPKIKLAITRMANTISADHEVAQELIASLSDLIIRDQGDGYVALERTLFQAQLQGNQRGLVRQAIKRLRPGLRDIDFSSVERAIKFINDSTASGSIDLVSGLTMIYEDNLVWLVDGDTMNLPSLDWPQLSGETKMEKLTNGLNDLSNSVKFQVDKFDMDEDYFHQAMTNKARNTAWMDLGPNPLELVVKVWEKGDRFQPLGMDGRSIKLGDFFTNVKLPKRARTAWPIVWAGNKIAWIPNHRLGHPFRITTNTPQITRIILLGNEEKT